MNVSLTPELEKLVEEKVSSGGYASASEVIREALRLLQEHDQLNRLRREVRLGLEQMEQGRVHPFDKEMAARVKREDRKRLATLRKNRRS